MASRRSSAQPRPKRLVVWMDGQPVAEIDDRHPRGVRCRYLPDVLARHDANNPLLSCSLPLRSGWSDASPFFDGLLFEGQARHKLAADANVTSGDLFGLLASYGADVAGALVVLPDGREPTAPSGELEILELDELEAEVAALPERPLGVHDDSELSLAGVQDKMLLVQIPDGRWARPLRGTPSTHVLKADHRVHDGFVLAEAEALLLARAVGLTSIDAQIVTLADVPCLIVSRFDRVEEPDGTLRRVHQEDACQALGILPTNKYEIRQGGGGPRLRDVARLLDLYGDDPLHELDRLAAATTFTALIGNADAHGKNVAFVHPRPGTVTLAPLYDTVPTALWPRLVLDAAMTIGAGVNLERVDVAAIEREAKSWRHSPRRAAVVAVELAEHLLATIEAGTLDPDGAVASLVRERAQRFIASR